MGTVYRAMDPAMNRVVALKTITAVGFPLQTEFRERFYREARAAAVLTHPGIVPVFDMGEHEGVPFLVMEFVAGRTLSDAAKAGERWPLDRISEIGQSIAEALGYAHQRGVVHRDIKPPNILLTSTEAYGIERPKITDFGLAKLAGQITVTGETLGTPAFMSPEQVVGTDVDGRADIFSLGVVLYWMATGEQPFPGDSVTAVSYKVVHSDVVPPRHLNPSLPTKLENLILKCLAKNPADRFQTGEELARGLSELRKEGPGPATTTTQAGRTSPSARKRVNWLALAAAIVVLAAAGIWYGSRGREKPAVQAVAPPPAAIATAPVPVPAPVSAPAPVPEPAHVPAPASASASNRSPSAPKPPPSTPPDAAPEETPDATAPAGAEVVPKKSNAKAQSKLAPAALSPAAVSTHGPAPLDFDPKTLDPKQNARLKIDASQLPARVDFTVEMNGKLYFQETVGSKDRDVRLFVPPGVHELRVTARSGALEKTSNIVSTEFKPRKQKTLKIELRLQGRPPEAGVPQDLYPSTQIVATLK